MAPEQVPIFDPLLSCNAKKFATEINKHNIITMLASVTSQTKTECLF